MPSLETWILPLLSTVSALGFQQFQPTLAYAVCHHVTKMLWSANHSHPSQVLGLSYHRPQPCQPHITRDRSWVTLPKSLAMLKKDKRVSVHPFLSSFFCYLPFTHLL